MNVLGQDCLVELQKQREGFFFEKKVVKWCTEYHHQEKTTLFLKNSDNGTILLIMVQIPPFQCMRGV